jgi:hypothetical protein
MKRTPLKFILAIAIFLLSSREGMAQQRFHLSTKQMQEVINIANAINMLNPILDEGKYLEYAVGIHHASTKYGIDPMVLIAIAQQETGFRENLPEGKAGEIGIIQIRKMWLKNPQFFREFKKQSIADLKKPAKSFLFAAWILKGLQGTTSKGSLPYWSYYNSVRFENRFKYFLAVNRNIATLRSFDPFENRIVASTDTTVAKTTEAKVARNGAPVISASADNSAAIANRWIPAAVRQVQKKEQAQPSLYSGNTVARRTVGRSMASPALIRAAMELDAGGVFQQQPLQD